MTRRLNRKFLVCFLLILTAVLVQIKFVEHVPAVGFLAPAALIASVFFLNFLELFFLTMFELFILNWQPVVGLELLILFSFIFLLYFLKRIISLDAWILNICATGIAGALFYGSIFLVDRTGTLQGSTELLWFISKIIIVGMIFNSLVFLLLHNYYEMEG